MTNFKLILGIKVDQDLIDDIENLFNHEEIEIDDETDLEAEKERIKNEVLEHISNYIEINEQAYFS